MPPTIDPVFELGPSIGIGVADFEKEAQESLLAECDEELEAGVEG